MNCEEFLTYYKQNAPQIMWLLGAGASARAGIKTAWEIVWDLKREIYCRAQSIDISFMSDVDRPALRATIQSYLDSQQGFSIEDSEEEYSFYLEYVYKSEEERREYLKDTVLRGKPSLGHYVLAALSKVGKSEITWTTNFDGLIEAACSELFGQDYTLYKCSVSESDDIKNHIQKRHFPLLVKLHGDYQYKKLANTTAELANQDKYLEDGLIESLRARGLAVVGYSGRDESVIQALQKAIADGKGYPFGLHWFQRRGEKLNKNLTGLAAEAKKHNITFNIIEIDTFDQLFGDIFDVTGDIPKEIRDKIYSSVPRYEPPAIPLASAAPARDFPIIRTNALPILKFPEKAKLIKADVGGKQEINEKIEKSGANISAFRVSAGIVTFGEDEELGKAFGKYEAIGDYFLGLGEIRKENFELGLLYELLEKGLRKSYSFLEVIKRRDAILLTIPDAQKDNSAFAGLKSAIKNSNQYPLLRGKVPYTTLDWADALKCKIVTVRDNLYLLIKPTVYVPIPRLEKDATKERIEYNDKMRFSANEFINKRIQPRWNNKYSDILSEWITILCGAKNATVKLFPFGNEGVFFELQGVTAFSNKATVALEVKGVVNG